MTDFFDWLTAADTGLGTDRLRERFRLSEEEMRRASEALAPAFLLGLQRLAYDPQGWQDFVRQMTRLAQPGEASASQAAPFDLLAKLFGPQAFVDSIARQASTMSGISPDTIAKMMPELGLMTVRTMMQMAGTPGAGAFAMPSDSAGLATAEMMRRSANALEAFSRPSSSSGRTAPALPHDYLQSLFADALKGGFPWMALAPGKPAAPHDVSPRPGAPGASATSPFFAFAPLFDAFADPSKVRGGEARRAGASEPKPAEPTAADPFATMTKAMEAGRALQTTYAQEMLALFDRHRRAD